jgi:hypothetical protein
MIWQNPWAWLGAAAIVLPILIHLLGRGHARVLRFPTLRFIDASRLLPTKQSRIQDPWLLVLRAAILALAAMALAQPLLLTNGRRESLDRGLARAIIVDTSASVRQSDSARILAAALARDAQQNIVVESNDPASELRGAAAWVAKQQRRGEIAIISDFQRGQIEPADLEVVPKSVGLVVRRVAGTTISDSVVSRFTTSDRAVVATGRATPAGTDVEWHSTGDSTTRVPVQLFAGPNDSGVLHALHAAAATVATPLPIDSNRAIAIVFSRYESASALAARIEPPRPDWQLDLLDALRAAGLPVSFAGNADVEGTRRFVLATSAEPTSLEAARLVAAARRATSAARSATELEPGVVSDAELRTWERPATVSPATQHRPLDDNGPSDARWLWMLVLALLIVEWRVRRNGPSAAPIAREQARAA